MYIDWKNAFGMNFKSQSAGENRGGKGREFGQKIRKRGEKKEEG